MIINTGMRTDIQPDDVIHQAEQKSWKNMQLSIFDLE